MSYIKIMNYFHDKRRSVEDIGVLEIALFAHLVDAASRAFWAEWFECSTKRTCDELGIEKMQLSRARKCLMDHGFIQHRAGNRKNCAQYVINQPDSYQNSAQKSQNSLPSLLPLSKREKESRSREREEAPAAPAATLGKEEMIRAVEAIFPNRIDVREIYERVMDRYPDRAMTARRLETLVRNEDEPKARPADKAPQPEPPIGWREAFLAAYPAAECPEEWADFYRKYEYCPDILEEILVT